MRARRRRSAKASRCRLLLALLEGVCQWAPGGRARRRRRVLVQAHLLPTGDDPAHHGLPQIVASIRARRSAFEIRGQIPQAVALARAMQVRHLTIGADFPVLHPFVARHAAPELIGFDRRVDVPDRPPIAGEYLAAAQVVGEEQHVHGRDRAGLQRLQFALLPRQPQYFRGFALIARIEIDPDAAIGRMKKDIQGAGRFLVERLIEFDREGAAGFHGLANLSFE